MHTLPLRLVRILFFILMFICSAESLAQPSVEQVGQWTIFQTTVTNHNRYENPFEEVTLQVTFTKPDGSQVDFWGFYDNKQQWKIRYMPDQTGTWQYQAKFSDSNKEITGQFQCVASDIPGMIHQDELNPIWFGYKGGRHVLVRSLHVGDRFFADTNNMLTGEPWNPAMRQQFLDWVQAQGYNMLSIASHYLNRAVEDRGLGWQTPDLWDATHQMPNPAAYAKMEAVLNELADRQLLVYPFAGFFGKASDFPKEEEKQLLYIKYTLARIAPYWNIVLLVGGPEPLYKKNPHLSKEEVIRLGNTIDSLDVFDHLLSVHSPTGDDPFKDEPWLSYGILQGPKTLDRQALSAGLLKNHHPQKPLYAQETLWPGNTFGHPPYSEDDIRKNAYVMMMSAAAINFGDMLDNSSSGFSGTLDFSKKVQAKHDIVHQVWDFFSGIEFYRMTPRQDLVNNGYCLAEEGKQYLIYLEEKGNINVQLPENAYRVTWINAKNPQDTLKGGITRDGQRLQTPNRGDDWLLWLLKEADSDQATHK